MALIWRLFANREEASRGKRKAACQRGLPSYKNLDLNEIVNSGVI